MPLSLLFNGMLIGFSIAAPVGQIGVLCIQRTLGGGRAHGLAAGLGAATADALYGLIGGLGLTAITTFLVGQQLWIRLLGGLFLLYLGVRTWVATSARHEEARPLQRSLWGDYISTFFLTLTSPATILSYTAIMAGLGVGVGTGEYLSAGVWVLGVFLGSATWWLVLSTVVGAASSKLTTRWLRWVNRASGVVIGVFGVVALLSLWR